MLIYHIDELITLLGQYNTDSIISDYISKYIETSNDFKNKIYNYFKNNYIDESIINNISEIYQLQLIQCPKENYPIINKYLHFIKKNYDWNVNNEEFIQYLIKNKPNSTDIIYALHDFFSKYNKNIKNNNNIQTIDYIYNLGSFNDKINDKYKVLNINQERSVTVLYINGTILVDMQKIHEELLDDYNNNYLQYKSEWITDLNTLNMPLMWGTIIKHNIPCARAILYNSHICELLICYAGNKFTIAQEISKNLSCKVYSFFPATNILIRNAKLLSHII